MTVRTPSHLLPALAALLSAAAFAGPAHAALTSGSEDFFEDETGLRLEPCTNADACPAADPAHPGAETYWSATASFPTATHTANLSMSITSEPDPDPAAEPGDVILTSEIDILARGLAANTAYRVIHPFGVAESTTNNQGRLSITEETLVDDEIAAGTKIGPFLRWAPSTAAPGGGAPAGHIADPAVPHEVVGSPTGDNEFRIETAAGTPAGGTDDFLVAGQVADGSTIPNPPFAEYPDTSLAFGTTQVGDSDSDSMTIRSTGFSALTTVPAISGPAASDYSFSPTCNSIAPLTQCELTVTFRPTTAGTRSAMLTVSDTTQNGDGNPATTSARSFSLAGQATPAPADQQQQNQPTATATATVATTTTAAVVAASPSAAQSRALPRLARFSVASRLRARTARRRGVAVIIAPASADGARIRLLRGGRALATRQVVLRGTTTARLDARATRLQLRPGTYAIEVTPMAKDGTRGTAVRRTLRIVR